MALNITEGSTLDDLLKRVGVKVARRKFARSLHLGANRASAIHCGAGQATFYAETDTTTDRFMDRVYSLVERYLPQQYMDYGRQHFYRPELPIAANSY